MAAKYAGTKNFGPGDPLEANPFTQCLIQDFFFSGNEYGPQSSNCRQYMAEYCAKNWTKACETLSGNRDNTIPHEYSVEDLYHDKSYFDRMTDGEAHIKRTAERKFCNYTGPKCKYLDEPFNPTVPNSPVIRKYSGDCDVKCNKFSSQELENDPVIDKCLSKGTLCADVFASICNVSKQRGDQLGPKMSAVCKAFNGYEGSPQQSQGGNYRRQFSQTPVVIEGYKSMDMSKDDKTKVWVASGVGLLVLVLLVWYVMMKK